MLLFAPPPESAAAVLICRCISGWFIDALWMEEGYTLVHFIHDIQIKSYTSRNAMIINTMN